ncbi:MAG: hypothetical protein LBE92_06775 [Chryseobacterium sp.]|jgi:hypothetical protein|uniref:hypothetical protein n=1 Tax=Chryseobacterium sp. TaxID=1871047 RepID=UPI0028344572|nr:hypothetical protein [Chryseobacterium sp.]MDR2235809.1 hypothetical protein [Chryseobacterium sp.]
MKALLFPIFLISACVSAQKSDRLPLLPKTDTAKILKHFPEVLAVKPLNDNSKKDYRVLYKILTVKPDSSLYMALKEPKKDISKFKIPNPAIPEIPKTEIKKEQPSK